MKQGEAINHSRRLILETGTWVSCSPYSNLLHFGAGGRVFDPWPDHTKDFKNGSNGCPHRRSGLRVSITTDNMVSGKMKQ